MYYNTGEPMISEAMMGLGQDAPPPDHHEASTMSIVYSIASFIGMVGGAYHGYKRTKSAGWAFGWALFGGALPIIAIPIALAQGFGKTKGS